MQGGPKPCAKNDGSEITYPIKFIHVKNRLLITVDVSKLKYLLLQPFVKVHKYVNQKYNYFLVLYNILKYIIQLVIFNVTTVEQLI